MTESLQPITHNPQPTHIGIDCRFAGTKSGLGCFTRELVKELLKREDKIQYSLFVRFKDEEWLRFLPTTNYKLLTAPYPHYSLSEQCLLPGAIRHAGIDLYFAPHFNVPLLCPVPFIVTIHDLTLHRFPNHASFLRRYAYRIVMKHAVKRAKHVITVSRAVSDDLMQMYDLDENAISIIHEAVNPLFGPQSEERQKIIREKYGLQKPFFLYVGNAKEHKNIPLLLDGFAKFGQSTYELVLVIGDGKAPAEAPHVRVLRSVPLEDLPVLYSAARAFVTATSYEGFGLPVAEALACGCPVIATHVGAIPEIVQDRGMLIEPTVKSLVSAFQNPPSPPHTRWERGWDEVVAETVNVFQKVL